MLQCGRRCYRVLYYLSVTGMPMPPGLSLPRCQPTGSYCRSFRDGVLRPFSSLALDYRTRNYLTRNCQVSAVALVSTALMSTVALSCSAGGPADEGAELPSSAMSLGTGGNSLPTVGTGNVTPGASSTNTVLLTQDDLVAEDPCDSILEVTYRDFTEAHPDFEMDFSGDGVRRKLIAPELGASGKPVFVDSFGCPFDRNTALECNNNTPSNQAVIGNAETFSQWYQTIENINIEIPGTLQLLETQPGSGLYDFNSTNFFPLGQADGFGNSPAGRDKNFLFTTEIHLNFSYKRGQKFSFRGDDDLWIFINRRLAMDLGSMHGPEDGEIDFDAQATALGIAVGGTYSMDIFHAERHTDGSNFSIETNIACFTAPSVY